MSETALRTALEEALRAINSMKVEAETAGAGGDEQMLQEACEVISNEGLAASMAIDAALALAAPAQAAPVDAAKLPSPANVGTAPKCLNLNDQAMWVLGWNECLDAARAAQEGKHD